MTFARRLFSDTLCLQISTVVKTEYFKVLLQKKMTTFNEQHTGSLTLQLNKEIDDISGVVTTELCAGIRGFLFFICGVFYVLFNCFNLVIFTVFPTIVLALAGSAFGKKLKTEINALSSLEKASNSFIQEKLMQIKTVKLFSGENLELSVFKSQVSNLKEQGIKVAKVRSKFFATMEFLGENTVIWGLGYGVYLMQSDASITIGKLTAFATYAVYAGMGYKLLVSSVSELYKGSSLYSNIQKTKSDLSDTESVFSEPSDSFSQVSIQFQAVSFSYPNRLTPILNDVSLNISAGEIWGVIGASGCGKSTLFHLLTHLYEPNNGKILLNSVDIQSKPAGWARQYFSIVSQEALLFSTDILENLRYANRNASLEEVRKACERADALEFIEELPQKFQTLVGENGFSLSGGQRQRICIARALLKEPKVLLLDEATSGLDGNSESLIQGIIEREVKKRGFTVIMITHRIYTLKSLTDYVALLKNGTITKVGTFEEVEAHPDFQALTRT